jgi:hypothetical protein
LIQFRTEAAAPPVVIDPLEDRVGVKSVFGVVERLREH